MKRFLSSIVIFAVVCVVSGCGAKKEASANLKDKLNSEIGYLDGELISMANELNNISYFKYKVVGEENRKAGASEESPENSSEDSSKESKKGSAEGKSEESSGEKESKESKKNFLLEQNNLLDAEKQIEWNNLKSKIDSLYTSITPFLNDIREIGVPEDDIEVFTNKIDSLVISIKNEDENGTLDNIIVLYEYLPNFSKKLESNNAKSLVLKTKYDLLLCYRDVNAEKWDEFDKNLEKLRFDFSNIEQVKDVFSGKDVNIKNIGLMINETKNTAQIREKGIFFIKYKNLMQELNVLYSVNE